MKLIFFLILFIVAVASVSANDKKKCKYGDGPVCGQPPMPSCPPGLACIQLMPAPKTYSNRCEMELAKADFIAEGRCEGTIIPCQPWEHQTKKGLCVACGDEQPWDAVNEKCLPEVKVHHNTLANPASVNCTKLGGLIDIVTTPSGGQFANCAIEKLTLLKAMKGRGLVKLPAKEKTETISTSSDDAGRNCLAIKGTLRPSYSAKGELEICVIEEWALMKVIDVSNEKDQ